MLTSMWKMYNLANRVRIISERRTDIARYLAKNQNLFMLKQMIVKIYGIELVNPQLSSSQDDDMHILFMMCFILINQFITCLSFYTSQVKVYPDTLNQPFGSLKFWPFDLGIFICIINNFSLAMVTFRF